MMIKLTWSQGKQANPSCAVVKNLGQRGTEQPEMRVYPDPDAMFRVLQKVITMMTVKLISSTSWQETLLLKPRVWFS